jgi:hypothetical protein
LSGSVRHCPCCGQLWVIPSLFVYCDHEYLNFRGGKFSKSRGAAVDVPYFLSRYDPDPLRYYLTATAPETRDTEFSWEDFVERNNNELVATWGNLANRMLSFAYKRFEGVVPEPGPLDEEDRALLARVEAGFQTVGELYNACKFRAALGEAMGLAREANGYLDRKAPWLRVRFTQCMPGPQGALVPDQGGKTGGGDQRLRHPPCRGQPEDHPGAGLAAHGAAAARVPGLRRAALWDTAGGRVPGRDAEP